MPGRRSWSRASTLGVSFLHFCREFLLLLGLGLVACAGHLLAAGCWLIGARRLASGSLLLQGEQCAVSTRSNRLGRCVRRFGNRVKTIDQRAEHVCCQPSPTLNWVLLSFPSVLHDASTDFGRVCDQTYQTRKAVNSFITFAASTPCCLGSQQERCARA